MKIDFYYWDMQCPINNEILRLLEKYGKYFEISIYNVKDNFEIARQQRLLFPTLTVVDGVKRYFSPLSDSFFDSLLNHKYPKEKPFIIQHGREKYAGEIMPITEKNIETAGTCTGRCCSQNSQKKLDFLKDCCLDISGFINIEGNKLLGGVEYVPSSIVPYDVPKSEDIAFLTCAYLSSDRYDYKSAPFKALEKYLKGKYTKIIAVSDEVGTFPNGDLKWFLDNGFADDGVISYEPGYCRLHLVSKNI
jgi:hypothetical protein